MYQPVPNPQYAAAPEPGAGFVASPPHPFAQGQPVHVQHLPPHAVPLGVYPHPHAAEHHHHPYAQPVGGYVERINAVPALVLGILGLCLFWPLSWVGVHLARGLRNQIRGQPHHPDHGMVMAAWAVNLTAIILGSVVAFIGIVVIALYAYALSHHFSVPS